jgi:transposase
MKSDEPPDGCWNCGEAGAYEYLDDGMYECERCGHLHMPR